MTRAATRSRDGQGNPGVARRREDGLEGVVKSVGKPLGRRFSESFKMTDVGCRGRIQGLTKLSRCLALNV